MSNEQKLASCVEPTKPPIPHPEALTPYCKATCSKCKEFCMHGKSGHHLYCCTCGTHFGRLGAG